MPPAMTLQRFQILLALAPGPLHGSGIARLVREQTGDAVRLWPVMLYATIDQLASDGLIHEAAGAERPEGASERRRYYVITARGRKALAAEAERLADLARTARATLARHQS
jgi:DNA-binding PadR family transcriptional regulator